MKWLIAILVLAIFLICGCTQNITPICLNTFPSNYDINNVEITLERTECYGTCPAYSLNIFGNGTVVYNGQMHVAVQGIKTSQISQDKVIELINEFKAADYFCLQDEYTEPVTDMPTTITSINIGGKTKRISDYVSGPDKLKTLENKIDEISGDATWIKSFDKACTDSGGTVKTQSCCNSVGDFPNTCSIGACGCSPTNSHEVKVCDCGEGNCWNDLGYCQKFGT